jgi:NAD(P)-dependent dehydrogenase (short-subunit alcohol dehydrogenase family)
MPSPLASVPMAEKWTTAEIPDQSGRIALVTGANSGIGLRAAAALAGAGAEVLLGCRNTEKGERALEEILESHPEAKVSLLELDLADLASVESAAETVAGSGRPLDLLINNAGVMAPPRMETADGFELQFGTNHLGHFALTGRLLETLLRAPSPRIVNVASLAHRRGSMDFDDLNWEKSYSRWPAYGRSKLANLLFTFELDRRLRAIDSAAIALACHPGYASTNLQTAGPGEGLWGIVLKPAGLVSNLFFGQSDEMGALPTLYAATSPEAEGSDYIGPDGIGQARGHPIKVGCSSAARDADDARRLWEASVELTGVHYEALESLGASNSPA